ncbi:orotidine-5'-phosphate decarboxylase [Frondihabitans cladoniiphilus]|uniref:Orotidine-5'-phosphate decarboxylase n=1 Tax=Frondihabitans cladoniiphilus TaxID=715785 RepID=A0ABP8VPV4_9MICO
MSGEVAPSGARPSFGSRLARAFDEFGQLCVGIDPHPYLLGDWGLPVSAEGARSFGLAVVEAVAGLVPIVKPQVAFFERYGSKGFAALEDVIQAARDARLLVIADAKRGDIGTTMDSYAQAWFDESSPLRADAVTVAAYQGLGANAGFLRTARETGGGVFVLAATSNPEARDTQLARIDSGPRAGKTVAAGIVDDVLHDNDAAADQDVSSGHPGAATRARSLDSIGLVLGATVDLDDYGIRTRDLTSTPILAPGFGAQGALYSDVARLYGEAAGSVLVSASRSMVAAGRSGVAAAARQATEEVRTCLA